MLTFQRIVSSIAFSLLPMASLLLTACVPKTQYEDQQVKLNETQSKLRALEASNVECDKDAFLQLKEQAQSLDLLTQELVDRNTELSKEVARLKVFESQSKSENQTCGQKMEAAKADCDGRMERIRATDQDLINELKAQIQKLKEELAKAMVKPTKSKSSKKTK